MNSLLETCRLSASVAVRCLCAFAAASAPAASAQSDGDTAGVPVAIGDLVLWVENVTGDIAEDLALTEVQSACLRDSKAANEERVRAAEARIEEVMLMTREGYTIEQLGIDRDEVIPSRWELISNIMMGLEPCLTEAQIEKLAVWYERLSGPAAAYIGFCGMLAADAHGVLLVYCEGHWRAMEEKLASSYDEQQRASALDAFFAAFANAVGGDPVTRMTEWRERVKVEESIQAHFGTHEQVVGDSVVPEVPDGWLDRRMWSELSEKQFAIILREAAWIEDRFGSMWCRSEEAVREATKRLTLEFNQNLAHTIIHTVLCPVEVNSKHDLRLVLRASHKPRLTGQQSTSLRKIVSESVRQGKSILSDLAQQRTMARESGERHELDDPFSTPEMLALAKTVEKQVRDLLTPTQTVLFEAELRRLERQLRWQGVSRGPHGDNDSTIMQPESSSNPR